MDNTKKYIKGLPVYDDNNKRRVIYKSINDIEYKFCKGSLCYDESSGEGTWKTLDNFNKCSEAWDKLDYKCKNCKSGKQIEEIIEENKDKKKCKICLEFKDKQNFSKNARYKDGLDSKCRLCKNGGKDGGKLGKVSKGIHTVVEGKEGKVCNRCSEWKSFSDNNYKTIGKYKDETTKYDTDCRKCFNEKERIRYEKKNISK